jgi:hypothetical protein
MNCTKCGWPLDAKFGPHNLCATCWDMLHALFASRATFGEPIESMTAGDCGEPSHEDTGETDE